MTPDDRWSGQDPTEDGFRRALRTARRRTAVTRGMAAGSVLSVLAIGAVILRTPSSDRAAELVERPGVVTSPTPSAPPSLLPSLGAVSTATATSVAASARPSSGSAAPEAAPAGTPAAATPSRPAVRPRSGVHRNVMTVPATDCSTTSWCVSAVAASRGAGYGWNLGISACVSSTSARSHLTFPSSREVDFVVEREGLEIWRWSAGVASRPDPHQVDTVGQQCVNWTSVWDGVLDGGGRGRPGDVLRVELEAQEQADTSRSTAQLA